MWVSGPMKQYAGTGACTPDLAVTTLTHSTSILTRASNRGYNCLCLTSHEQTLAAKTRDDDDDCYYALVNCNPIPPSPNTPITAQMTS